MSQVKRQIKKSQQNGLGDQNDQDLIRSIFKAVERYNQQLQLLGIQTTANPSVSALEQIKTLQPEQIAKIIYQLNLSTKWMIDARLEGEENFNATFLKQALSYFGLKVADDFLETIDETMIVEIYSVDMIQLFRNLKLHEVTGYSIFDLSVFEWFKLWERPKVVNDEVFNIAVDIFKQKNSLVPINLKTHLLKETFNSGLTEPFEPRSLEVDICAMGYLTPLHTDSPEAIIYTCKARVVSIGDEDSRNILFIR